MSYILDALKKSEEERAQSSVPQLQAVHSEAIEEEKKSYLWLYLIIISFFLAAGIVYAWKNISQIENTKPDQEPSLSQNHAPNVMSSSESKKDNKTVTKPTKDVKVAKLSAPAIKTETKTVKPKPVPKVKPKAKVKDKTKLVVKKPNATKSKAAQSTKANTLPKIVTSATSTSTVQTPTDEAQSKLKSAVELGVTEKSETQLKPMPKAIEKPKTNPILAGQTVVERDAPATKNLEVVNDDKVEISSSDKKQASSNVASLEKEITEDKSNSSRPLAINEGQNTAEQAGNLTSTKPALQKPTADLEKKELIKKSTEPTKKETNQQPQEDLQAESPQEPQKAPKKKFKTIGELPTRIRNSIPDITFSGHVFNSAPERRSVIINGKKLREGEFINADVHIDEITEAGLILQYKNTLFRLGALQDWHPR